MMEESLFQALVMASSGMFSIGSILIALLLLSSTGGPSNALAYVIGYFTGYLLIGLLVLGIGSYMDFGAKDASIAGPTATVVLGMAFLFGDRSNKPARAPIRWFLDYENVMRLTLQERRVVPVYW
jgi:hypothetical protein